LTIITDNSATSWTLGFTPPKNNTIDFSQRDTGFYYQHGHVNLFRFLHNELSKCLTPSIMIQRVVRVDDQNNPTGVSEIYGFVLIMEDDGTVIYYQLTAQEVYESYIVDCRNGKPLTPDKNDIYRGSDPNDTICGFDMV
jgi:hypothetical protein